MLRKNHKIRIKSSSWESIDSYQSVIHYQSNLVPFSSQPEAVIASAPLEWQWNFRVYLCFVCMWLNSVILFFLELYMVEIEVIVSLWQSLHFMQEPDRPSSYVWKSFDLTWEMSQFLLLHILHSLPCGGHFTFVVTFHFSAATVWSVF